MSIVLDNRGTRGQTPMSQVRFEVKAVSSSRPRTQSMEGKPVSSAIVRKPYPASEPLVLTTDGIEGNQPAIHNAHVYALFAHHYDMWTAKLGVERSAWGWCHWGENVTLDVTPEIDESNLMVGDVWQFGDGEDAVKLQVTGSRIPCDRLSWRCGQPLSWLKDLAASGNCGLYLTVLKGGKLYAGDKGRVIHAQEDSQPIASIVQVAYSTDYSAENKATVKRILEQTALQQMNRTYLQKKLDLFREKEVKARQAWKGWRDFEVSTVKQESPDVKSFYLRPEDGKALPSQLPGQFLTVKLPTSSPLVRCWTLSHWSSEETTPEYRLTIKKAGPASNFLFDQMEQSGKLRIQARAPAGIFVVERESTFPLRQIYVSGGIGITPSIAMLQAHSQNLVLRKTAAICVHVTQNSSTLLFADFLHSLPDFIRVIIFFTRPLPTDLQGKNYTHRGRPTLSFWQDLLAPDYGINPLDIVDVPVRGKQSDVYLCGPSAFEQETKQSLLDCGVSPVLIKSENFTGASASDNYDAPEDLEKAKIRFTTSEKDLVWSRDQNVSILELAEEAGLDLPKGCEAGICGSCEVKVCKGMVTGGSENQVDARICLARPATAIVEIEA